MLVFYGSDMRILFLTMLVACGQPQPTKPLAVSDGELLLVLVNYLPGYLDKNHASYRLLVCREDNYDQQTLKGCQPALIDNKRREVFFRAGEINKPTGRHHSKTGNLAVGAVIGTTLIAAGIVAIAIPFRRVNIDDLGADALFLVGAGGIVLGIIALAGGNSRLTKEERRQLTARFHEIEGFSSKLPIASIADEVRDLAAIYRVKINKAALSSQ